MLLLLCFWCCLKRTRFQHGANIQGEIMQCKHPCETSWCYPEQEVMTVVTLVIFYVETEWCKTCPVEYHHSRDIKVEHDWHGIISLYSGASPGRKQWGGQTARVGLMASAEREPITGVWGQSPQRGPGALPLVTGSAAKPPEAESILPLDHPYEGQNLPL